MKNSGTHSLLNKSSFGYIDWKIQHAPTSMYKKGNSFAHDAPPNLNTDDDGAGLVVDKRYTIHIIPSYVCFSFLTNAE